VKQSGKEKKEIILWSDIPKGVYPPFLFFGGGNMPKLRKVVTWRTIKPRKDVYIHVAVLRKKGKRGGRTVAGHIRYVGSKKVKRIR